MNDCKGNGAPYKLDTTMSVQRALWFKKRLTQSVRRGYPRYPMDAEVGMRICLYCGLAKPDNEFSDEHIWPDALGGNYLPRDVWRTDEVCQRCNSLSGLFVDGSFIRSWMGKAESSNGSLEYLAGKKKPAAVPLNYIGPIQNVPTPRGHVADYWAGPCGANIIHIRPDDGDEQWANYVGGDPKAKKAKAGRAYIALTSEDEFWVLVSLMSFKRHFSRQERFIVNADFPPEWHFKKPDRNDPVQAEDMKTVDTVINYSRTGRPMQTHIGVSLDLGSRLLAKLGLAVGYKLLGPKFLTTESALNLRRGMREANFQKRRSIPLKGSNFLARPGLGGTEKVLSWPGGWVLMVSLVRGNLGLCVISPSGRSMIVLISEDQDLIGALDPQYKDGTIWITVPAAEEAISPIQLAAYLAHQTNAQALPTLTTLASKRGDWTQLPPCRPAADQTTSDMVSQ